LLHSAYVKCPVCGRDNWRTVINGDGFRIDRCASGCIGRTVPPPEYSPDLPPEARFESLTRISKSSGHFRFADEILNFVKTVQPSGKLLDIGSGWGHLLISALDRGYDAIGLEASSEAVNLSREAFGVNPIVGVFPDYTFEPCSFDVVVMNHMLEHLQDPATALSEVARILKPDGICAIDAPDFDSLIRRIRGGMWQGIQPSQHVWQLSMRSILELVRGAGLTPIVARRSNLEYPRGSRPFQKWLMLRFMLMIADLFGMGDNAIVLARK